MLSASLRLGPLRMAMAQPPAGLVLSLVALLLLSGACAAPPPAGAPVRLGPGHRFRPTSGPVIASPLVADIDADGRLEIAVGSWDGYFYVLDEQLRDKPGWPHHSPGGYFSSAAAGDLDGDGRTELVVGSEAGQVYAWRADGSALPGWPVDLRHRLWSSPSILPGGRVAILGAGQMFVLDARGRPVKGWPRPVLGWGDSTAAFDGQVLAIATLAEGVPDAGGVHAWRSDGAPLAGFPVRLARDSDSSPALADLDGDGRSEIIVGDDAGMLHVFSQEGEELPGFPVQAGSLIEASPAIGDLDGDGRPDIVVGSWDGRMYAWDRTGAPLPGWPVAAGDQIISSAGLVDLDGDGLADVVAGSKDHHLYAWGSGGQALAGFPVELGAHVFSSPWVGELVAQPKMATENCDATNGEAAAAHFRITNLGTPGADIVVGANNGIHVLEDAAPLGARVWPRFHRDDALSGWWSGTAAP